MTATADVPGGRGNLRWAVLFAMLVVAGHLAAGWMVDRVGEAGTRPAWGLVALSVALAPVALFWVVAEAHLRWSPRGRIARTLVGWTLVFACLGLLLASAPAVTYIVIMSLGYAFAR